MKQQKEMVDSFLMSHREFMTNLDKSFELIENDLREAQEIDAICTGPWCKAIESSIDELAKYVYSISEPRWVSDADSKKLSSMRHRIHDLYSKYKSIEPRPSN